MTDSVSIVGAWHDAVNARDLARLTALVADDVELVGPRGPGAGRALVLEWVSRAGIQLYPTRFFQKDEDVVVEQQASWTDPDTGQAGEPQTIASTFVVQDGRVARITRFADLTTALAATGHDHMDEIAPPGA